MLAPAGTAIENMELELVAPDWPVMATPFCRAVVEPVESVLKVALTVAELVPAATTQLPVPLQEPPQPAKVLPDAGDAESVVAVVVEKLAEAELQVVPQLMPLGLLVTVPVPVPAFEMEINRVVDVAVKLAVTLVAALTLTVHELEAPEQAPLQPEKVLPVVATADKVTLVPLLKLAEQVEPHEIPEGLLLTVPIPVPDLEILKV